MGTKFTQLKTGLSQNNWLVFVVFLMYNFHLSFAALYYFVGRRKNYRISSFIGFYVCFLTFRVSCFRKCYPLRYKNENSVVFGFVLSSKVKN